VSRFHVRSWKCPDDGQLVSRKEHEERATSKLYGIDPRAVHAPKPLLRFLCAEARSIGDHHLGKTDDGIRSGCGSAFKNRSAQSRALLMRVL
jgi:hypothetical protein